MHFVFSKNLKDKIAKELSEEKPVFRFQVLSIKKDRATVRVSLAKKEGPDLLEFEIFELHAGDCADISGIQVHIDPIDITID